VSVGVSDAAILEVDDVDKEGLQVGVRNVGSVQSRPRSREEYGPHLEGFDLRGLRLRRGLSSPGAMAGRCARTGRMASNNACSTPYVLVVLIPQMLSTRGSETASDGGVL